MRNLFPSLGGQSGSSLLEALARSFGAGGSEDQMGLGLLTLGAGGPRIELIRGLGDDSDVTADGIILHDSGKYRQVVQDGICKEEKTVQLRIEVRGGIVESVVAVYETDDAAKPQAEWRGRFSKVLPLSALRALDLLKKFRVIGRDSTAIAFPAVLGSPGSKDQVIELIGQDAYDEIVEGAPDGTIEFLQKLHENGIDFDVAEVQQAVRSMALEECDGLEALGIEHPTVLDARIARETKDTEHLVDDMKTWHTFIGHDTSFCTCMADLRGFTAQALSRGIDSDALALGTGIFVQELSRDTDLSTLSQEGLNEAIDDRSDALDKVSEFVAVRFQGDPHVISHEISEAVRWWNVTKVRSASLVEKSHVTA